jgi:hypothetical protein
MYHYYNGIEKINLPKFEWGRIDDCNAGHTQDEWGSQQNTLKKIRFIEAYTVTDNLGKTDTRGFLRSHLNHSD